MMIEELPLMGKLYTCILGNLMQDFDNILNSTRSRKRRTKEDHIRCYGDRLLIYKFKANFKEYAGRHSLIVEYTLPDETVIHLVWPGVYVDETEIQILAKSKSRSKHGEYINFTYNVDDHTPTMRKHIHEIFVKLQNILKEHGIRAVTSSQVL